MEKGRGFPKNLYKEGIAIHNNNSIVNTEAYIFNE